jgi:hypothetical protein
MRPAETSDKFFESPAGRGKNPWLPSLEWLWPVSVGLFLGLIFLEPFMPVSPANPNREIQGAALGGLFGMAVALVGRLGSRPAVPPRVQTPDHPPEIPDVGRRIRRTRGLLWPVAVGMAVGAYALAPSGRGPGDQEVRVIGAGLGGVVGLALAMWGRTRPPVDRRAGWLEKSRLDPGKVSLRWPGADAGEDVQVTDLNRFAPPDGDGREAKDG